MLLFLIKVYTNHWIKDSTKIKGGEIQKARGLPNIWSLLSLDSKQVLANSNPPQLKSLPCAPPPPALSLSTISNLTTTNHHPSSLTVHLYLQLQPLVPLTTSYVGCNHHLCLWPHPSPTFDLACFPTFDPIRHPTPLPWTPSNCRS